MESKANYVWGVLRLAMGWMFLWSFFDKLFGLGFSTPHASAWIAGGSPTVGFLKFATKGPFVGFYQGLAGNPVVDWLFMLGLLFIGVSLIFGVLVRLSSWTGFFMVLLMYTAGFMPPAQNPFLDEHIFYLIIFIGLILSHSGYWLGLGRRWASTRLVQNHSYLE